jgi:hypothetical protein
MGSTPLTGHLNAANTNEGGHDPVHHPPHYQHLANGVETIDVTEWFNFNKGNAIKYIWRSGVKDPAKEVEDLEKAKWYIDREINRLKSMQIDGEQLTLF